MNDKYPIGTRIRFNQDLIHYPDEEMPRFLYARKGDLAMIIGYNDWRHEGYKVKPDRSEWFERVRGNN